jgi:PPOX class probable F420-dependent enzyme
VDRAELVSFVRARGLGVVATTGPTGSPEAALVGIAASDEGELIFDTSTRSRKLANLSSRPRVALVVGWDDEVTLQVEGDAEVVGGDDFGRCLAAYVAQYPDGAERARDPQIVLIRVQPMWGRLSDYRPGSFGTSSLDPS